MRVGTSAWGLQSHPEVDLDTVRGWAHANWTDGLLAADVVSRSLAVARPPARPWSRPGGRSPSVSHNS